MRADVDLQRLRDCGIMPLVVTDGAAIPPDSSPLSRAAGWGYVALALGDTLLAASSSPQRRRLRALTKPLLMPALGTAFATSLSSRDLHHGGVLRGGTVAAQALSGVGDIALLRPTPTAFLAGLGSFLGAHLSYTAAFASTSRHSDRAPGPALREGEHADAGAAWVGPALAAAGFATLGPALSGRASAHDPALRVPVLGYAAAISGMVAAATRIDRRVPRRARRRIVAGSALFLGSDALLGLRTFVLRTPPPWTEAAVMATYTLGQGLIAAGVSEAVQARSGTATPPHPTGTAIS